MQQQGNGRNLVLHFRTYTHREVEHEKSSTKETLTSQLVDVDVDVV